MRPRIAPMLLGAVLGLTFIDAKTSATGGGGTLTKPVGIAAGDLVLAIVDTCSTAGQAPSAAAAFTHLSTINWSLSFGYNSSIAWKQMTTADLAAAWTNPGGWNGTVTLIAYRGPSSVTLREAKEQASSLSSLSLAGVTLAAAGSMALFTALVDRDPDATDTPPTGFTGRSNVVATWRTRTAELASPLYSTGTAVVWTATNGSSQFAEVGWLVEFIR